MKYVYCLGIREVAGSAGRHAAGETALLAPVPDEGLREPTTAVFHLVGGSAAADLTAVFGQCINGLHVTFSVTVFLVKCCLTICCDDVNRIVISIFIVNLYHYHYCIQSIWNYFYDGELSIYSGQIQ